MARSYNNNSSRNNEDPYETSDGFSDAIDAGERKAAKKIEQNATEALNEKNKEVSHKASEETSKKGSSEKSATKSKTKGSGDFVDKVSGKVSRVIKGITGGITGMVSRIGNALGMSPKAVTATTLASAILFSYIVYTTGNGDNVLMNAMNDTDIVEDACARKLSDYNTQEDGVINLTAQERVGQAKKIYRYLSSLGYTDEAIAGMLANAMADSNIQSTRYEGDDITDEFNLLRNHHSNWSAYTTALFTAYETNGPSLTNSLYKPIADGWDSSRKSYYEVDDNTYLPGFGLWQWTGKRANDLLEFANCQENPRNRDGDDVNDAVFEIPVQIAYLCYENYKDINEWGKKDYYIGRVSIVDKCKTYVSNSSLTNPNKWVICSAYKAKTGTGGNTVYQYYAIIVNEEKTNDIKTGVQFCPYNNTTYMTGTGLTFDNNGQYTDIPNHSSVETTFKVTLTPVMYTLSLSDAQVSKYDNASKSENITKIFKNTHPRDVKTKLTELFGTDLEAAHFKEYNESVARELYLASGAGKDLSTGVEEGNGSTAGTSGGESNTYTISNHSTVAYWNWICKDQVSKKISIPSGSKTIKVVYDDYQKAVYDYKAAKKAYEDALEKNKDYTLWNNRYNYAKNVVTIYNKIVKTANNLRQNIVNDRKDFTVNFTGANALDAYNNLVYLVDGHWIDGKNTVKTLHTYITADYDKPSDPEKSEDTWGSSSGESGVKFNTGENLANLYDELKGSLGISSSNLIKMEVNVIYDKKYDGTKWTYVKTKTKYTFKELIEEYKKFLEDNESIIKNLIANKKGEEYKAYIVEDGIGKIVTRKINSWGDLIDYYNTKPSKTGILRKTSGGVDYQIAYNYYNYTATICNFITGAKPKNCARTIKVALKNFNSSNDITMPTQGLVNEAKKKRNELKGYTDAKLRGYKDKLDKAKSVVNYWHDRYWGKNAYSTASVTHDSYKDKASKWVTNTWDKYRTSGGIVNNNHRGAMPSGNTVLNPFDQKNLKPSTQRGFDTYWYLYNGKISTTNLSDIDDPLHPSDNESLTVYTDGPENYVKYKHRYEVQFKDEKHDGESATALSYTDFLTIVSDTARTKFIESKTDIKGGSTSVSIPEMKDTMPYVQYQDGEDIAYECAVWFYKNWKGKADIAEDNDDYKHHTDSARYWYYLIITEGWRYESFDASEYKEYIQNMLPTATKPLSNEGVRDMRDDARAHACGQSEFSNATIADTAVSLSYPYGKGNFTVSDYNKKDGAGVYNVLRSTAMYVAVRNIVNLDPEDITDTERTKNLDVNSLSDIYYSNPWAAISTAVRASGRDDDFPDIDVAISNYLNNPANKRWSYIDKLRADVSGNVNYNSLKPGDIVIGYDASGKPNDAFIYVGRDAVKYKFSSENGFNSFAAQYAICFAKDNGDKGFGMVCGIRDSASTDSSGNIVYNTDPVSADNNLIRTFVEKNKLCKIYRCTFDDFELSPYYQILNQLPLYIYDDGSEETTVKYSVDTYATIRKLGVNLLISNANGFTVEESGS